LAVSSSCGSGTEISKSVLEAKERHRKVLLFLAKVWLLVYNTNSDEQLNEFHSYPIAVNIDLEAEALKYLQITS